jgi:integrase
LLTTRAGKVYRKGSFSDQFRSWCYTAGLPQHCVFHGLRKAACRRLAEVGCTSREIMAISGHKSLSEVERYTKAVDQAKLAQAAMVKTMAGEQNRTQSVEPVPDEVSKVLIGLSKKAG